MKPNKTFSVKSKLQVPWLCKLMQFRETQSAYPFVFVLNGFMKIKFRIL